MISRRFFVPSKPMPAGKFCEIGWPDHGPNAEQAPRHSEPVVSPRESRRLTTGKVLASPNPMGNSKGSMVKHATKKRPSDRFDLKRYKIDLNSALSGILLLLLMVQKSGEHQLRLVGLSVYPRIYKALYSPGGLPHFFHQHPAWFIVFPHLKCSRLIGSWMWQKWTCYQPKGFITGWMVLC